MGKATSFPVYRAEVGSPSHNSRTWWRPVAHFRQDRNLEGYLISSVRLELIGHSYVMEEVEGHLIIPQHG